MESKTLAENPAYLAPDGMEVRPLCELPEGGMAHFLLPAGAISRAVVHKSVSEIWYFLTGVGEMWRAGPEGEEIVSVGPGVCLTIPAGTSFQTRALAEQELTALATTMPPWPGPHEATVVSGAWEPAQNS